MLSCSRCQLGSQNHPPFLRHCTQPPAAAFGCGRVVDILCRCCRCRRKCGRDPAPSLLTLQQLPLAIEIVQSDQYSMIRSASRAASCALPLGFCCCTTTQSSSCVNSNVCASSANGSTCPEVGHFIQSRAHDARLVSLPVLRRVAITVSGLAVPVTVTVLLGTSVSTFSTPGTLESSAVAARAQLSQVMAWLYFVVVLIVVGGGVWRRWVDV